MGEFHATFSPSSHDRLLICAGSYALTKDLPRSSSKYAAEGTAAHTLASRALTYGKPCVFWIGEQIEADGYVFVVDQTMADAVQVYVDEVMQRVGSGTLLVEQRVDFSEAIGVPGQSGTADAIILSEDCTDLTVLDLKYGMGVRVEAEENPQLMSYALAVLETYGVVMGDVKQVTVGIVQPRLDHIDTWTFPVERLAAHADAIHNMAVSALEAATILDSDGEVPAKYFQPHDDACRFCRAKPTCVALQRHVSALVMDDFTALDDPTTLAVLPAPKVPAGDKLGALYGVLDLIEDWCRAVRGEVERMVLGGMTVIGPDGHPMKLVEGKRGNRSWINEEQAASLLSGFIGPDKLYQPQKLITPAVADKILKKDKGIIADYVKQSAGRPKVTLGSDPAPPYVGTADASEFDDMTDPCA
jgi:hypothetical protein